jgi:two-component system, NarL family, response regulator DegU
MTILIVDDNAPIRQMILKLVGDLTEGFAQCSDGSVALEAYEQHHPDWVLMDIRMRERDRLAAATQIKAAHPEARIIIVTGYEDSRTRQAAHTVGAFAFVNKENLHELREVLTRAATIHNDAKC